MNKWKKALKLIKYSYSYQKGGDKYLSIFFIVMGVLLTVISGFNESFFSGGILWLVLGPVTGMQMMNSLLYSHMITASGKKKLIDVTLPNIWTLLGTLLGYGILMLLLFLMGGFSRELDLSYIIAFLRTAVITAGVIILIGMSAKLFWQGVTILIIAVITILIGGIFWERSYLASGPEPVSLATASLLFLVIIMIGVGVSCLLRVAFYKHPVVRGQIGKQMLKSM